MSIQYQSRRSLLRQLGLAGLGLSLAEVPSWALTSDFLGPLAVADDDIVPFTDIPATFNPISSPTNRFLDIRTINGPFTPRDQFFTTQHYGHPEVDPAAF